jgi:hypothetical protein
MVASPKGLGPEKSAMERASSIYKRQTSPLVREGAPQKQDRNCQTVINIWLWALGGARHQDLLTDWPSVARWFWLWIIGSWERAAVQRGPELRSRGIVIARSRYQATTIADTAGLKRLSVCCRDLWSVEISDSTVIKCNYELCVKVVNESNIQPKTASRFKLALRDNILNLMLSCIPRTYSDINFSVKLSRGIQI